MKMWRRKVAGVTAASAPLPLIVLLQVESSTQAQVWFDQPVTLSAPGLGRLRDVDTNELCSWAEQLEPAKLQIDIDEIHVGDHMAWDGADPLLTPSPDPTQVVVAAG